MNSPTSENDQKQKKISLNTVLILISLLLVSVFGIIFLTQIEVQPGWKNQDMQGARSGNYEFILHDDITGDSVNDIFCYFEPSNSSDSAYNNPDYGQIITSNGLTGGLIWAREFKGPVMKAFQLRDIDNDGIKDFLVNFATVYDNWDSNQPNITTGLYGNQIVSGKTGTFLPILEGDGYNFTREYIFDCVLLNDSTDFIVVQRNNSEHKYDQSFVNNNVTHFHANGTVKDNVNISYRLKFMDLLPNDTQSHLLLIGDDYLSLRSLNNFSDIIFENTTILGVGGIETYCIVDDVGNDGVSEIILGTPAGNIYLINGSNGLLLHTHSNDRDANTLYISPIRTVQGVYTNELLVTWEFTDDNQRYNYNELVFINATYNKTNWIILTHSIAASLESDFTGDGYPEIIIGFEEDRGFSPMTTMDVRVVDGRNPNSIISLLKIQNQIRSFHTVPDIDGDNKNDAFILSYAEFGVISSKTPIGLWLSPSYMIYTFPIFLALVGVLAFASYKFIRAFIKKEFEMKVKENLKRFKISVIVNVTIIGLMTFMFLFFMVGMNVFNTTLLLYDTLGSMMITSLIVFITWFTFLPLVGAIYNKTSARFSYYFLRLRDSLFKLSKKTDHDIMVVDVDPKVGISIVETVKRSILPMLLSLTIGFLVYNFITPILGVRRNFDVLGGSQFFEFLGGYFLYAILPMILTFVLFSFFISAGWLLDDGGLVYYHKFRNEHIPGDVERISVWQQGWLKGLAGFSSLITFYMFASTIDLTEMLTITGSDPNFAMEMFSIFGFITTSTIIYGFPFLTAFCYMFFSVTIMEVSIYENREKLYGMMKKGGYDVTPKNLEIMLYPNGFKKSKISKEPKGTT